MSEIKISQLPAAATLSASSVLAVVQSGATYQASSQQIYGANRRDGIVSGVTFAADGSATVNVTFAPPFATLVKLDAPCFVGYSGANFDVIVWEVTAASASGFSLTLGGGEAGDTLDVHWGATGR